MDRKGISRLAVVSATFGKDPDIGPFRFRPSAMTALANICTQMAEMESLLSEPAQSTISISVKSR